MNLEGREPDGSLIMHRVGRKETTGSALTTRKTTRRLNTSEVESDLDLDEGIYEVDSDNDSLDELEELENW